MLPQVSIEVKSVHRKLIQPSNETKTETITEAKKDETIKLESFSDTSKVEAAKRREQIED